MNAAALKGRKARGVMVNNPSSRKKCELSPKERAMCHVRGSPFLEPYYSPPRETCNSTKLLNHIVDTFAIAPNNSITYLLGNYELDQPSLACPSDLLIAHGAAIA